MSWLEVGPTPTDLSALPVSARSNVESENEYDHVSKSSQSTTVTSKVPVINGEDVEDMKQRLATFEYLLR